MVPQRAPRRDANELSTIVAPKLPIDLDLTLAPLAHGAHDPTMRRDAGAWWRATRTPLGPTTVRYEPMASGGVRVRAWGDGAEWAIAHAPDLVGANDSLEGFAPTGKLAELHRRFAGLRVVRSRAVFEAAVAGVVGQLVTFIEAFHSFASMLRAWGEAAPGPIDLTLPLSPSALARRASWELREHGVERKRAATLVALARRAPRLEEAIDMPMDRAHARLLAMPGIGPWTTAKIAAVALGDADAVPVGDFHLKHAVAYAFTGRARGDDEEMLELLAPYAGHRGRVVRLIELAGIHAPRFGPRRALRKMRSR